MAQDHGLYSGAVPATERCAHGPTNIASANSNRALIRRNVKPI